MDFVAPSHAIALPADPPDRASVPRAGPVRRPAPPDGRAGPALGQEPPTKGGRVLDSPLSEPDSLDPARANLLVSQYVLGLLYDRLVYIDQTGRPRPWLAESWSVDKDGKEVTFVIRKGVTFTDGTPLDAEAVRDSLDRDLKISKRNARSRPDPEIEAVGNAAACG